MDVSTHKMGTIDRTLGVSMDILSRGGKIDVKLAMSLSRGLGGSPKFWMDLRRTQDEPTNQPSA